MDLIYTALCLKELSEQCPVTPSFQFVLYDKEKNNSFSWSSLDFQKGKSEKGKKENLFLVLL